MASEESSGVDLGQYIRVVRRHVWLIVICTVVLGAAGYFYAASKTPMYSATARLLYEPQIDISGSTGYLNQTDPYTQALELDSAVTVIGGPDITKLVRAQLGNPSAWPSYHVTAALSATSTTTDTSSVLEVTAVSPVASWASKIANAYASQFIAWRVQDERARISAAEDVISQQLKGYTTTAEQASANYVLLSERLQSLQIMSATATGDFRVVSPADTPTAPYSPRPKHTAALAAAVGLVLGLALAFLRQRLDTSLHSHREVRDIMGLPVVGRIPRIPDEALAKGAIVVASETDGRAAESMRVLRSNLEFVCLGDEYRRLMVVSAQKGEGKSLVTANLAASLALAGKKVALVDADLRRPRLHTLFNVGNTNGVSSVVAGRTTLESALQTYELMPTIRFAGGNGRGAQAAATGYDIEPRLRILTSGPVPPNPGEMVASGRFADIVDKLSAMDFDYVLIDSPAFLPVGDAAALAAHADGLFLLVNLRMTGRPMLEDAREFLAPLPAHKLGLITVGDQSARDERYHYYGGKY